MKVNSDYIKVVLLHNFRFQKQFKYVTTEAGRYNSDVLAINKSGKLVEVEVKVSKTDLTADFRKPKHLIYQQKPEFKWTPHQFYFAVPKEIVEFAIAKTVGKPYGVIVVEDPTQKIQRRTYHVPRSMTMDAAVKRLTATRDFEILSRNNETRKIEYGWYAHVPMAQRMKVIKRASALSDKRVDRVVIATIAARMSSEVANLRRKLLYLKESSK